MSASGQTPLALGWAAYGVLHSILAARGVKAWFARRFPGLARRYRLGFNLIAVVTLLPLAWLHFGNRGEVLWAWQGAGWWLMNALALLALYGSWRTAKAYDMGEFLGLKAMSGQALGEDFRISFSHRFVRHPWYFQSLILVWTRDMDEAMLVSAIAISVYFAIGSWLEERKLMAEFGEAYGLYRTKVPALVPLPWKWLTLEEAEALSACGKGR